MTVVGATDPAATLPGAASPRPPSGALTPPWTKGRVFVLAAVVAGVVLFVLAWHEIGMGILPFFRGIGNIFRFLSKTVPPEFSGFAALGHTVSLALQTVCMAVLGTVVAAIISVVIGLCAARNTAPHPVARWAARALITFCRSVPDLVFAIVFVQALGIGIVPGVLALGLHSVGMLGKLFAETVEQVPPQPGEALDSTGARRLQRIATGVVPQVMPAFLSISIYRLDINLRSSVVLGYVGAGGIGFALNAAMGQLQFREALAIVLVMFVLIVLMEVVAAFIRRSLIGLDAPLTPQGSVSRRRLADRLVDRLVGPAKRPEESSEGEIRLVPPWTRQRFGRCAFAVGAVVIIGLSFWDTRVNPISLFTAFGKIGSTVKSYFPPDFTSGRHALISGTLQSASVALVATTIGLVVAVPIGLLAARNVSSRWTYRAARTFLVVIRAVPELILAIVFVVAVGLGLVAGTFALIIGTVAFMSKLVADGIEEVPPGPREAILSVGATRPQETATAVVGPSVPSLVGNGLYMMDVNFRSSTILGMVGGGGIGYLLQQSVQVVAYRTTGAIIVATFVVVLLIEILTSAIRKQIL